MPERAAVNQVTQLGVEATPGTAVAANRLMSSFGIGLAPEVEVDNFRPRGQKYDTIVAPVKEWSAGDLEGRPDYNELAYLLSSVLTTGGVIAGGGAGSFVWSFLPSSAADDAPKTLTVENGSSVRAHRAPYVLVTELGLTFDRDAGVSLDGAVMGQRIEDAVTLTAAPTQLPSVPVLVTGVDVFMDPTFAGIGATKLARVKSAEFTIGDRWNPVWIIDSTKPSYAAHTEGVPSARFELTMEADAAGMGLLPVLRAGDTRFFRVRAQGPLIAGATSYQLVLDLSAKVLDVGDFEEADGLVTIGWTFDVVHDPTAGWARAFRIDLTNTLAAL